MIFMKLLLQLIEYQDIGGGEQAAGLPTPLA
jgi:hypothetical protein